MQNTAEKKNSTISHAQNTTAFQPNLFLTRILRLLAHKNKSRSAFRRANHCQGQLQTSQSLTVGDIICTEFITNSMDQSLYLQANCSSEH